MGARHDWDDYTVEIGADKPHQIRYEFDHPNPLRIHYRVYRIPSRKVFLVCNFVGSTGRDRAEVDLHLPQIPAMFASIADRARRIRARDGHWFWTWPFGTPVEDPLVQLELEMMIDQGASGLIGNG